MSSTVNSSKLPAKKQRIRPKSQPEVISIHSTADSEGVSQKVDSKRLKISCNESKSIVKCSDEDQKDCLRSIRLRSSPSQLCAVMTSMSTVQRQVVNDLGFGSLLGFNIKSLPRKLTYHGVDKFVSKDMVIRNDAGDIKCDKEAVHDVFGIPMVDVDIYDLESNSESPFVKRWLWQFNLDHSKISPTHIAEMITDNKTSVGIIFKMNVLMLFANTMVTSESNGYIVKDVLNRVSKARLSNDADIRGIDWCGFLLKALKSSKSSWDRENPSKCPFPGPATFLTLLYVDRTVCEDFPVVRSRPIFKNWTGYLSARERAECASGSFGMLELSSHFKKEESAGEGFFICDDVKDHNFETKEAFYKFVEDRIGDVKKFLLSTSETLKVGLSKFPDNPFLMSYNLKIYDVMAIADRVMKVQEEEADKNVAAVVSSLRLCLITQNDLALNDSKS